MPLKEEQGSEHQEVTMSSVRAQKMVNMFMVSQVYHWITFREINSNNILQPLSMDEQEKRRARIGLVRTNLDEETINMISPFKVVFFNPNNTNQTTIPSSTKYWLKFRGELSKNDAEKERINDESSTTWENLDIDVLLSIFQRLDLKDLAVGAALCCPSWYMASKDPSLWRDVDITLFNSFIYRSDGDTFVYYPGDSRPVQITQLIEFVVIRSQGSLTSIKFPNRADHSDLLFVAERCPGLEHFEINLRHRKFLRGRETIGMTISKLKKLESMDVQEIFIDESTLELIGECCPNFIKLKLCDGLLNKTALLISTLLPKLKVLDLSRSTISREALLIILKGCKKLEYLDVSVARRNLGALMDGDSEIERIAGNLKEFKWR